MRRNSYIAPEINIVVLSVEQIIATSTENWGTIPGGGGNERKERSWGCSWNESIWGVENNS